MEQLERNCPFIEPLTAGKKFNFTSWGKVSSRNQSSLPTEFAVIEATGWIKETAGRDV